MNHHRRISLNVLAMAIALGASTSHAIAAPIDDDGFRTSKVYTSTNGVAGNEVLVFEAAQSGRLTLQARFATNGQGTSAGLGNQGAVALSKDGRYLFVVNAKSNNVSTFSIDRTGLALESVVDSGGLQPISVTESGGIVYVLNSGGAGNVTGFRNAGGTLEALPNGRGALSASGGVGPAQAGFSPEGDLLVVTEKATNKLTSYRIADDGGIGATFVSASSGMTPFGFAFDRRGDLLVSEAFGGAASSSALSSYGLDDDHNATTPIAISRSIRDTQTAACWVVTTPNGHFAYTTNTGSGTVSSYAIDRSGRITLANAVAGVTGAGPIDAAVQPGGAMLFVLNAGSHSISTFSVAKDGSLSPTAIVDGIPAGATGLAAN